jgi:hypothetical protein
MENSRLGSRGRKIKLLPRTRVQPSKFSARSQYLAGLTLKHLGFWFAGLADFWRRCFFPAARTFLAPRVFFFSCDGMLISFPRLTCTAQYTLYISSHFEDHRPCCGSLCFGWSQTTASWRRYVTHRKPPDPSFAEQLIMIHW